MRLYKIIKPRVRVHCVTEFFVVYQCQNKHRVWLNTSDSRRSMVQRISFPTRRLIHVTKTSRPSVPNMVGQVAGGGWSPDAKLA
jgi:hypothetical protein